MTPINGSGSWVRWAVGLALAGLTALWTSHQQQGERIARLEQSHIDVQRHLDTMDKKLDTLIIYQQGGK